MQTLKRSARSANGDLAKYLLEEGYITARDVITARAEAQRVGATLSEATISLGLLTRDQLTEALASFTATPLVSLKNRRPAPELSARFDLSLLLRYGLVPLEKTGDTLTFAISDSERFSDFLQIVGLNDNSVSFVFARPTEIMDWLVHEHRSELVARASSRVCETESCRTWKRPTSAIRLVLTLIALIATSVCVLLYPFAVFAVLAAWACLTLIISAVMRTASYLAEMSARPEASPPECPPSELPKISVIVPLFKEREIAGALVQRLSRLTYPKPLLDVVLAVEEHDTVTRQTIETAELPPWMTVVVVPEGSPKTKPRALNYALDFCQGELIGIWDAEDAPAHDQLETVARHFYRAPEDVVCLQGILDYYNSTQNWLARCFTIEYAAWFRMILPGMARLGFAIPLGGTTLFFKRHVLEELGGWDAHNVTEDADLGFRLARHGYRTEVIKTRTGEEANCKAWPWIKQRSRWLKGYMVTYLVHMRHPAKLFRQLGTWRFLGFQAHFVSALSQFILAPILWSFWLVLIGLPHPLEAFVHRDILLALGLSFLLIEVVNAIINMSAVARPGLKHLLAWVPTMHFYYPLGALAAYKALYELIAKPFYWDKTQHGLSLAQAQTAPSGMPGIELQSGHEGL